MDFLRTRGLPVRSLPTGDWRMTHESLTIWPSRLKTQEPAGRLLRRCFWNQYTQCVGKKILETCLSAPKSIYGFPGNSLHCWDIQVAINFEDSNLAHGSSGIFLLAVCFIHASPCSGLWDQPHNLQGECKIKVWDSVFKLKSQGSDKGALKRAQGSFKGGTLGDWPWATAQVKCPRRRQFSLRLGKLDPANSSAVCFWLCSMGRRPWQSWLEGRKEENILFLC